MESLGIAASIEPNNAQHLFNMAIVAEKLGKRDVAIKNYEDALEIDLVYGRSRSVPRNIIYDRLTKLRR
jgi:tetratricopeptide (TPR) repeat protein